MGTLSTSYLGGSRMSTETDTRATTFPLAVEVLYGVSFGVEGAEATGTVVLPGADDVKSGVTYGPSSGLTGTYAPATDYPAATDVRSGVDYNFAASTGTLVLPAESAVQNGVQYGAGGTEFTGTYNPVAADYPAVTDVRYGVSYDSGSLVGTLTLPAVGDVQSGVQFGAGGTEYTGTFTSPSVGDVQSGVSYGADGTEYTGTFVVPTEAQVESGVGYGAGGTEFTGTLTGGGGSGGVLENVTDISDAYNVNETTTKGVQLTSGASYVKGSYVELIASTDAQAVGIMLFIGAGEGSFWSALDIAFGESGYETIVIENIHLDDFRSNRGCRFIPLAVPAGTRISARIAAGSSTSILDIAIALAYGTSSAPSYYTTLGSGFTSGSSILPSSYTVGEDTKSSWVQLSASFPDTCEWVLLTLYSGNGSAYHTLIFDIATGTSGSEVTKYGNFITSAPYNLDNVSYLNLVPLSFTSGDRVSTRAQIDYDSSSFEFGVVMYVPHFA